MASTTVSEGGRVVIPKAIRRRLGIEAGDVLELEEVDGEIVLRRRGQSKIAGPPRDWRDWRGLLAGTDALLELEIEHRREADE